MVGAAAAAQSLQTSIVAAAPIELPFACT